jgi:polyisoprenoid-binding protein YceI
MGQRQIAKWLGAFAALVGLTASGASAQEERAGDVVYEIDPAHTYPNFEVKHLGISTHRGRFNRTTGRVVLNPESKTGRIDIQIDTSTVDTGNKTLESLLRSEDFFDVGRYKSASFISQDIDFDADGRPTRSRGNLTLRGVTRPVVVHIGPLQCTTFLAVRYVCGADMHATIKRSEYGMTIWRQWVSDDVRLVIQVEAIRQTPINASTKEQ